VGVVWSARYPQNKTKQNKTQKEKKAFSGQESQRAVEPSFLEIDQEAREGTRKSWV
jgi:hypothetical protein